MSFEDPANRFNTFLCLVTDKMKTTEDLQKGEIVQAVVIADSFDSRFGPLTSNKPRVSSLHTNYLVAPYHKLAHILKVLYFAVLIAIGKPSDFKLHT